MVAGAPISLLLRRAGECVLIRLHELGRTRQPGSPHAACPLDESSAARCRDGREFITYFSLIRVIDFVHSFAEPLPLVASPGLPIRIFIYRAVISISHCSTPAARIALTARVRSLFERARHRH